MKNKSKNTSWCQTCKSSNRTIK